MCAKSQSTREILQQIDRLNCEIAEARKQVAYGEMLKHTRFLQGYREGKFSLVLNLEARLEVNDVAAFDAICGVRASGVEFAALISHGHSSDMPSGTKFEKQDMLVRNIQIVKSPDNTVVPSFVWLNFGDDAIKECFTPGVYLNTVKGSFETLLCLPNWKLSTGRHLVGQASLHRAVPCEVESSMQIVEGIPNDQRQVIQSIPEIRKLMFERLSSIWALLDRSNAGIFERVNSGIHVRDMLIGPFHLESSISVDRHPL